MYQFVISSEAESRENNIDYGNENMKILKIMIKKLIRKLLSPDRIIKIDQPSLDNFMQRKFVEIIYICPSLHFINASLLTTRLLKAQFLLVSVWYCLLQHYKH